MIINSRKGGIVIKKKIVLITFYLFLGLLVSVAAYCITKNPVLCSTAITFGTAFYHFAMRLAVGFCINTKYLNHMDAEKNWFREKSFEPKFYSMIQVKKWKKRFPAFNPQDFQIKKHSLPELIQTTCQAEIVHEVIMILSFVPILFSICFGAIEVFLITSLFSCLFDGIFVIIQRYNRPRLTRLLKK